MPDPVSLRPARQAEEKDIRALIRKTRLNPMGLDWRRFIVAVTPEDRIIGVGQLRPHRDGSMELASLAVERRWRRRGIARRIIEHLIAQHDGPLYLTCASRLEGFYRPFGFQTVPDPQAMPPYFRRVWRLFRLLSKVRPDRITLLVMKKE